MNQKQFIPGPNPPKGRTENEDRVFEGIQS